MSGIYIEGCYGDFGVFPQARCKNDNMNMAIIHPCYFMDCCNNYNVFEYRIIDIYAYVCYIENVQRQTQK